MTTEGIRQIDALLVHVTRWYPLAVRRLTDSLPGISGRPAGNGEPGGGHGGWVAWDGTIDGGWSVSVVERAVKSGAGSRRQLERTQALPGLCVAACDDLAGEMGIRAIAMPHTRTSAMQWAWCQYSTRLCRALHEQHGAKLPTTELRHLYNLVIEAANTVDNWTGVKAPTEVQRTAELATDNTETWCRSCLRVGQREPRSSRYATDGLCRWCGDFSGAQGFMPTVVILDARHEGRKITDAFIRSERPSKARK